MRRAISTLLSVPSIYALARVFAFISITCFFTFCLSWWNNIFISPWPAFSLRCASNTRGRRGQAFLPHQILAHVTWKELAFAPGLISPLKCRCRGRHCHYRLFPLFFLSTCSEAPACVPKQRPYLVLVRRLAG